jgi:hypothetical protein
MHGPAICTGVVLALLSGLVAADNITANTPYLQTWWHDTGEINYQTVVQEGNVRQSHVYSASVKSTADSTGT